MDNKYNMPYMGAQPPMGGMPMHHPMMGGMPPMGCPMMYYYMMPWMMPFMPFMGHSPYHWFGYGPGPKPYIPSVPPRDGED